MSSTVIYNDFKAIEPFRNRFRRAGFKMWDANLHHGDVRPFACPELLCENVSETAQQLYPLRDCVCNYFEDIVDPVLGFCHDQHFFIQNGVLQQSTTARLCNNQTPCRAGAPFQPSAPSVDDRCGGCDGVGVAYVITYVTRHAGIEVESAPSPASEIVASQGDVPGVRVDWGAAPSGYCIVATRLYRVTSTFEDGTNQITTVGSEFVFVAEFSGSGARGYTDNVSTARTGGPLTTYDPMAFPAPTGVKHLVRTGDGIAVADDHRVYISVPGQPQFTWDGVVEIESGVIRGLAAIDNTIFVFTDNYPVKIAFRLTDRTMAVERNVIQRRLPLRSKRSLSTYDSKVFFSSTYSLYSWDLGGYGSDIKTEPQPIPLMTPEQWKNIRAENVIGVAYEFGYIFTTDDIDYSVMLEIGGDRTDTLNHTSFMPISYINADAFATDQDGHILYREGGAIYRWDWRKDACRFDIYDNNYGTICDDCCPWKIIMYFDNEGKNRFSKMRIEWDERSAPKLNAVFWYYAFGQETKVAEFDVISSRGFSIPKYTASQTFGSEVSGCGIMHEIRIATSNQELVSNSNNQLERGV